MASNYATMADWSESTAASYFLFATPTKLTTCMHGAIEENASVCQALWCSIFLQAKGINELCILAIDQQLSGVKGID